MFSAQTRPRPPSDARDRVERAAPQIEGRLTFDFHTDEHQHPTAKRSPGSSFAGDQARHQTGAVFSICLYSWPALSLILILPSYLRGAFPSKRSERPQTRKRDHPRPSFPDDDSVWDAEIAHAEREVLPVVRPPRAQNLRPDLVLRDTWLWKTRARSRPPCTTPAGRSRGCARRPVERPSSASGAQGARPAPSLSAPGPDASKRLKLDKETTLGCEMATSCIE